MTLPDPYGDKDPFTYEGTENRKAAREMFGEAADRTSYPSSGDPGPGCASAFAGLGCIGKAIVVAVLVVGLVSVAFFNGDDGVQTPANDSAPAGETRWAGTHSCTAGDLGLRVTTRFAGEATAAGAPLSIVVEYYETPVGPDGDRSVGDRLGQTNFSGVLVDGVVTFERDGGDIDGEPFAASAGRARITANPDAADVMSGRLRAPGCSTFSVTQLGG